MSKIFFEKKIVLAEDLLVGRGEDNHLNSLVQKLFRKGVRIMREKSCCNTREIKRLKSKFYGTKFHIII